jgi:predicted acyltransferase
MPATTVPVKDEAGEIARAAAAGGPLDPANQRLMSLDVFRGATIASMLLVNNPGDWAAVYAPLLHAPWHGWTFTDVIFPFFLWIVGVAMTLSFAKRVERGNSRVQLRLHALRRSAIIFALGLLLSGFPYYNFATIRIPGVLQRIAICYFVASVIFLATSVRGQIIWTGGLLSVYWILMKGIPVPGYGPGVLEKVGNFAQYVDSIVLSGHMWSATKVWDPEGIVSTLPAVATTLFGILTGHILRLRLQPADRTTRMFVLGASLMFAGSVMNWWLPINKNLWTSSYSVFMAGLAATVFAFCHWVVDVQNCRRWAKPFVVYGMNAITIFVLAGALARSLGLIRIAAAEGTRVSLSTWIFTHFYVPLAGPKNASLMYAITYVLLFWGIAYFLHRRKLFLKV